VSDQLSTRPGELRNQGTWAIVDQIFSSGTNFIPSLVLARLLGPQSYGTFSLAFLAWFLALSVIRSALMQPYTLAASPLEQPEWRELTSRASGIVLAAGLATTVVFALVGLIVGISSELGRCLGAIALLAPGLALQEFWRAASFASRRARTAAANDFYWAVGQTLAFIVVLLTTRITAAESLIAWGAGAWFAAALGLRQLSVTPCIDRDSLSLARQWLRVGMWFTGAIVSFSAGLLGVAAIVTVEAGNHGLGLFRMVQGNLFGPVQLVLIAVQGVFLPHMVRAIRSDHTRGLGAALRFSMGIAATVAVYGIVLKLVAPVLLTHVFGRGFAPAVALVLPMLIAFTIDAAGEGAAVLLRADARGRSLLISQLASAITRMLAVVFLVRTYGVVGAAWGFGLGSAVSTALLWILATRVASGESRGPLVRIVDDGSSAFDASRPGEKDSSSMGTADRARWSVNRIAQTGDAQDLMRTGHINVPGEAPWPRGEDRLAS